MSAVNLATVFGPTVLPAPSGDDVALIRDSGTIGRLLCFMINAHKAILADDDPVPPAVDFPEAASPDMDPTASPDIEEDDDDDDGPKEPICRARALYNYTARSGEELSFQEVCLFACLFVVSAARVCTVSFASCTIPPHTHTYTHHHHHHHHHHHRHHHHHKHTPLLASRFQQLSG
jgi:hypothetical protein